MREARTVVIRLLKECAQRNNDQNEPNKMAVLITTHGTISLIKQSDIGRYVGLMQVIPCTQGGFGNVGAAIWCDEEGMYNHKQPNEVATGLLGEQVFGDGPLLGDVAITIDMDDDEFEEFDYLMASEDEEEVDDDEEEELV